MTTVGDILELSYGKALKESNRDGGDVPVVGSGGIVGGHSTAITDAPTIVIGRKGSIGSVTWINGPAWPIDTAYFVTPKRDDLDYRWAYWMLTSLRMETMNKSAAVPGLNRDDVYRLKVTVPPLSEQRRITAILDHTDALRAKRRQVLAHLHSLALSIFDDMFESSNFESVALKSAIKWSSGKFLPAKDQNGGPHPVYGGNGINGYHDDFMFEEPRLVVGRVGAYCGAVHVTKPLSWVTDNALIATLLRDDLTLEYLLYALVRANLNQYAGVSGQPSISGGKIGDTQLWVPPIDLQQLFANHVEKIGSQIALVETAILVGDALFSSIQSYAFQGGL